MNKTLNLVEILKDCPKGTKLYSIVHGEVEFYQIALGDTKYPICFKYVDKKGDTYMVCLTMEGKYVDVDGECILFPSKENRDWSKFNIEPEMIDGEVYYAKIGYVEWVYIYRKNYTYKTQHYVAVLNNYLMEFNNICTTHNENIKLIRKATEEEKRLFFEIIEKNGRKWDEEKKELVKIEPKFDINTLQPFDKVLVRSINNELWLIDFFSHIIKNNDIPSPIFCCMCSIPQQCIPYNEETKHLVNTHAMPPKKYITWKE